MKGNLYHTKQALEIKDLDLDKRQVAVYLNTFDVLDSDMDIIRKGAFKKSLLERGPQTDSNRKIAFLRYHDWEQQIGKFDTLEEDDKGLFAVGTLGRSTKGEDALRDYEDGIIKEHSIGFQYIADKIKWVEDTTLDGGGFYDITEVKLFEGSAVTFGSNEYTNVVEVVKSGDRANFFEKITKDINLCIKALTSGKGSDERLFEIEMKLSYLNSQLILLAQTQPTDIKSHLVTVEPEVVKSFDWASVVNSLKV